MKLTASSNDLRLGHNTRLLLKAMLSPLCGLNPALGFMLRGRRDPRFFIAGAQLTGVHWITGQPPPPKPSSYHIGGAGVFPDEAIIRSLAETAERYSQLVAEISCHHTVLLTSHEELASRSEAVVAADKLRFFSPAQYGRTGFPFQPFSRDRLYGWVKAPSLLTETDVWVPAQLVFLGYKLRNNEGESWLMPAVTTGSAAHTNRARALRNALLELVQIDAVMGHWYSARTAPQVILDQRTRAIEKLISRQFCNFGPTPRFFWVQNSDLPGFTIACMIKAPQGETPAVSVGLGSDLNLLDAMYKSLLESVGVFHLGKLTLFDEKLDGDTMGGRIDPASLFDLDRNVAYYADSGNAAFLESKFVSRQSVLASNLPPDLSSGECEDVRLLAKAFRDTKKELVCLDLTTPDIHQLGLVAVRVWSPDTLSLSLPSAPSANHLRFKDYGGFQHENPHPYP